MEHVPGQQTMGSVLPMEMIGPVVTGATSGFFPLFLLLLFNFIYLSSVYHLSTFYLLSISLLTDAQQLNRAFHRRCACIRHGW